MFFSCGVCLAAIDAEEMSFISCSGTCDKKFHPACVGVPAELLRHMRSLPGISWKCNDCNRKCFSIDQAGLIALLNEKYTEMLQKLDTVFDDLKVNFLKTAEANFSKSQATSTTVVDSVPSYSDTLKNKTQPAILIKPKVQQTTVKTKVDVKENINTVDMQLSLSKVKSVRNGGMVVGFSSKEDNNRFKKAADEKLGDKYEIVELKGVQPRVKIVGMNQIYSENEILEYVDHAIRSNTTDINLRSECSIIKFWHTKKNPRIYQAIVQLDRKSYDTVMNLGGLFVGYDHCSVFDAIEILRCYKCNGFHHSSRYCKAIKSCPRCATVGDQVHALSECKGEQLKCINCVTAIESGETNINPEHAAWDVNCPMYQRAVVKFKKDLLFKQ